MAILEVPPAVFTYAHLLQLREVTDDNRRFEIIDGVLYATPAPGFDHQVSVSELARRVGNHVSEHNLGIVLVAPLDVIFGPRSVVEPDILYLTNEQVARAKQRGIEEAPTLVVEVLSPSSERRDRHEKRALYQAQGVPHLWLVDPLRRTLDAYVLRGARYERSAHVRNDDEFRPVLFPGLVIPLAEIWSPRARGSDDE